MWGKKTPKKKMDNASFLWRHMTDLWDTLFGYILLKIRLDLEIAMRAHQAISIHFSPKKGEGWKQF